MGNSAAVRDAGSPPPQISFADELRRKGTHMFALVIPGGYYVLGLDKGTMLAVMIPIAAFVLLVDIARLRDWPLWRNGFGRVFGSMIRAHEKAGDFTGATYILWSTVATVALFAKPIAIAALAFIIVGDTLAAIIGRRYGRHKFLRNKSIEGSLACLGGTLVVGVLAPGIGPLVGAIGAVAATVSEAMSSGIDDNVSVPLISGLAMSLLS